jgi:hypothetical protein
MSLRRVLFAAVLAVSVVAVSGCATDNPVSSLSGLDATAPGAPTMLKAEDHDGSLVLSWSASADADVAGYNVYRYAPDPARENSYVKINGALVTGTRFAVTDAGSDPSWYRIKAVDTSANASAASAAIEGYTLGAMGTNDPQPREPGIQTPAHRN